ncbi:Nodulin-like [Dillenia turbinata]|uniref:Nodulin-like n=1 Tax=Dillenia turbinata TaxID=194707 RepID=A0AAN8Z0H7_9MAGN
MGDQGTSKWVILVASIWIQAFTGTNFDFSVYSSELKSVMGISQVQLNYLSLASDLGKAFGWCCGLSLVYLPLGVVLLMAAFMGLFAYGLQWLLIKSLISMPYPLVFLLCLLAGCSICWFNTICYILCIRNFQTSRAPAVSLTTSFNGLSAALYTLIANAIDSSDHTLYLLLNASVPLLASIIALVSIHYQSIVKSLPIDADESESLMFLLLNILAAFTGLHLLILNTISYQALAARAFFAGAVLLLVLPLFLPGIVHNHVRTVKTICSNFHLQGKPYESNHNDLKLHKGYVETNAIVEENGCCEKLIEKDESTMHGEEHSVKMLVQSWDFWLYYVAYFSGGTIAIVYSNNLGQISESLDHGSETSTIVTLFSTCSFFGRLLSAAPDYLHQKFPMARTGWLAIALSPLPIAFFLLAASGSTMAFHVGTALVGLSSGFIFSVAVSITSEIFGPKSLGVNHNILITNIPLGSLFYGFLAAVIYDLNSRSSMMEAQVGEVMSCMGKQCYMHTFLLWGCFSLLGLASSFLLFRQTRPVYDRFLIKRNQKWRQMFPMGMSSSSIDG